MMQFAASPDHGALPSRRLDRELPRAVTDGDRVKRQANSAASYEIGVARKGSARDVDELVAGG
jgi:hypothetical protein